MKAIVGILLVLALVCVGCADDDASTPVDGGTDVSISDAAVGEASLDAAATDAGSDGPVGEGTTPDVGVDVPGSDDGAPSDGGE